MDRRPVLSNPNCLEVLHALARPNARENRFFLFAAIFSRQKVNRLTNHFFGRVAIDSGGATVPRKYDAGQILADNRVFGSLDYRGEPV